MPFSVRLDRDKRLVLAVFVGKLSAEDVRQYVFRAWATDELTGFRELVDLRAVDVQATAFTELLGLAQEAPSLGIPVRSDRLALVVSTDGQAEKAEFFGTARASQRQGADDFRVFRSIETAEQWLDEGHPAGPERD
jgi:hypothetical protein